MKSAIAIVYTGPHEEIRLKPRDREFVAQRDGRPILVDKDVALELLARSSEEHGNHWKCADDADQKDVDAHFEAIAEEAKKKAEAAAPEEKPVEKTDDKNEPVDATTPKQ